MLNVSELVLVEEIIKGRLASNAPAIHDVSSYLLGLGGKRIRPALCILCAKAFGIEQPISAHASGKQLLEVSAGIELIHMATLLHDDIIDKALKRRHKESALVKYGATKTLLAGDFLLVRAFGLCARLDRFIIEATEHACVALTEGEVSETALYEDRHSLESSLAIARDKTAALFSLACLCAGHLSGLPREGVNSLGKFGEELGIAFQVLDDLLDVTSPESLLGKAPGQDIRERKPSVINVLWLESGSELAKRLEEPPEASGAAEEDFIESALAELSKPPALVAARTKEIALERVKRANQALFEVREAASGHVVEGSFSELLSLTEFVTARLS